MFMMDILDKIFEKIDNIDEDLRCVKHDDNEKIDCFCLDSFLLKTKFIGILNYKPTRCIGIVKFIELSKILEINIDEDLSFLLKSLEQVENKLLDQVVMCKHLMLKPKSAFDLWKDDCIRFGVLEFYYSGLDSGCVQDDGCFSKNQIDYKKVYLKLKPTIVEKYDARHKCLVSLYKQFDVLHKQCCRYFRYFKKYICFKDNDIEKKNKCEIYLKNNEVNDLNNVKRTCSYCMVKKDEVCFLDDQVNCYWRILKDLDYFYTNTYICEVNKINLEFLEYKKKLDQEECLICFSMVNKKDIIVLTCSDKHKLCSTCLVKVYKSSNYKTNLSCSFCRQSFYLFNVMLHRDVARILKDNNFIELVRIDDSDDDVVNGYNNNHHETDSIVEIDTSTETLDVLNDNLRVLRERNNTRVNNNVIANANFSFDILNDVHNRNPNIILNSTPISSSFYEDSSRRNSVEENLNTQNLVTPGFVENVLINLRESRGNLNGDYNTDNDDNVSNTNEIETNGTNGLVVRDEIDVENCIAPDINL